MKKHQRIALQLGIAIPSCLLSVGSVQAANNICDRVEQSDNNEVIDILISTQEIGYSDSIALLDHTNNHTNLGGSHSDQHTDKSHTDYHSNKNAMMKDNMCTEHSDKHVNNGMDINEHTNSGNRYHTDYHTDRQDAIKDCY